MAFGRAYTESGFGASGNGAYVNGARLARRPEVAQRIAELRATGVQRAVQNAEVTREYVLTGLSEIAKSGKNESARVRAYELLGKTLGLFVDRTEVTTGNPEPELDPTMLSWDELQTILVLQRKARRTSTLGSGRP